MSISPQVAAFVGTLDKETLNEVARNVVSSHELGCTCAFCEFVRSRYPSADVSDADVFEKEGGAHQTYPFDAESTIHLASIAKSLSIVASAVSGLRDIFRGRDSDNAVVQSPYRVLVDHIIGRKQAPAAGPSTQRTPAPVQAPAASTAPAAPPAPAPQANLFGAQKRVATDTEMAQMVTNLSKFTPKIRFDVPQKWPKESQKGRAILVTNGGSQLATEVDPEYLPIYADQLDWFASKAAEKVNAGTATEQEKKNANFDALDAARCRRIAQCVREGSIQYVQPAPVQTYSGGGDYG